MNNIINAIKDSLLEEKSIIGIVLCGSSDFSEDIHIDLFIIVEKNDVDEKIQLLIKDKKFQEPIQLIIKSLEEVKKIDSSILQDIFKEGKVIYWNSSEDISASVVFKLKPYTIFTFELKGLIQKEKVKFNYQIYGKKNNGLLNELGGIRFADSCFYIPLANKYKLTRILNRFNIQYKNFDIWM